MGKSSVPDLRLECYFCQNFYIYYISKAVIKLVIVEVTVVVVVAVVEVVLVVVVVVVVVVSVEKNSKHGH